MITYIIYCCQLPFYLIYGDAPHQIQPHFCLIPTKMPGKNFSIALGVQGGVHLHRLHPQATSMSPVQCLVTWMFIIYIKHKYVVFCFSNSAIAVGDAVYVVGTPFGSLSPTVFLNSVSKGVLSNIAGACHELLLTDARCMPGTEGGAVYTQCWQHDSLPVGIVVAPLCWKANEWIGLSLACRLSSVLNSLESVLNLRLDRGISKSNPV